MNVRAHMPGLALASDMDTTVLILEITQHLWNNW